MLEKLLVYFEAFCQHERQYTVQFLSRKYSSL